MLFAQWIETYVCRQTERVSPLEYQDWLHGRDSEALCLLSSTMRYGMNPASDGNRTDSDFRY